MAILANEKVPTLDYWKTARQLAVGDYVFDRKGNVVQVKLLQEYRASHCYRITFSDYLSVSGDSNLGFEYERESYRNCTYVYQAKKRFRAQLFHTKVKDLVDQPLTRGQGSKRFSIPTTDPLKYPHQELPVPPFIFGFWFFNRKASKKMVPPPGMKEEVYQEFKDAGYAIKEHGMAHTGERFFSVTPTIESHLGFVIPHKIPNNYLMADPTQRVDLLRGIMHSQNHRYSQKKDLFRFTSKKPHLVTQIQQLAESLGHKTKLTESDFVKGTAVEFRSKLKLLKTQVSKPLTVHQDRRFIISIEEIEPQACVHIETTAPDNTLIVGEGFIPVC